MKRYCDIFYRYFYINYCAADYRGQIAGGVMATVAVACIVILIIVYRSANHCIYPSQLGVQLKLCCFSGNNYINNHGCCCCCFVVIAAIVYNVQKLALRAGAGKCFVESGDKRCINISYNYHAAVQQLTQSQQGELSLSSCIALCSVLLVTTHFKCTISDLLIHEYEIH